VAAIAPQVDLLVVVAHGEPEYAWEAFRDRPAWLAVAMIPYYAEVPNISTMWNMGLSNAHNYFQSNYDVAVLNDDAIVPDDWFGRVTAAMRDKGAAAGCVLRPWDDRMAGYAFVLDGDRGLRLDEQFRWWYGDTDLQRQAEAAGGVAFAHGRDVEHRHPDSTTVGVLAEVAAEDRLRYERKWG
jgi:GT2 family glycosyltransferase